MFWIHEIKITIKTKLLQTAPELRDRRMSFHFVRTVQRMQSFSLVSPSLCPIKPPFRSRVLCKFTKKYALNHPDEATRIARCIYQPYWNFKISKKNISETSLDAVLSSDNMTPRDEGATAVWSWAKFNTHQPHKKRNTEKNNILVKSVFRRNRDSPRVLS